MKTIIYSILFVLISINTLAQNENISPFIGTWEWQEDNKRFIVEIYYKYGNALEGNFKMEETTANGLTSVIYTSNKLIGTIGEVNYYNHGFSGHSENGVFLWGTIVDRVLCGDGFHTPKMGSLGLTIQSSCSTCPTTATWVIEGTYGLHLESEPDEFTIPTDIILTKID